MFALCSAAAGLFSCVGGWMDGSYVGVPQYGYTFTTSEAACLAQRPIEPPWDVDGRFAARLAGLVAPLHADLTYGS